MDIDNELYQLSCIKNMEEKYLKKWENIKNTYALKLDEGPIYRPVAYTYHDYTHHCYNIYKIVSKVILYRPQFTKQEWFILNTAILLHDFSMTFNNFDRLIHSKQSADWLLEEWERERVLKNNLSKDEVEVVALIIKAHSDCKSKANNKEVISEYTLENPELQEQMDCGGAEPVRAKFLAAILRTADECDVTRDRLGTADFESLDNSDSEQRYSMEQWLQLKCFRSLRRNQDTLLLTVDDVYVKTYTDEKGDIADRIDRVVSKIRKQINYVRKQAVTMDDYAAMFQVQKVAISSSELDSKFVDEVNNKQDVADEFLEIEVQILDEILEQKIAEKIDQDGLKTTDHYIVTDSFCEQDWIELRGIVTDNYLANQIIDKIINDIRQKYKDEEDIPIIVAMEENSLILASQIAYRLGFPFSYIIPCNYNLKKSSVQERNIDLTSYNKIILITDTVATFQTLGVTCDKHSILNKVCKIYTILYREPDDLKFLHKEAKKLSENMTACCNKYPITVHDRKKCPFNDGNRCSALNK